MGMLAWGKMAWRAVKVGFVEERSGGGGWKDGGGGWLGSALSGSRPFSGWLDSGRNIEYRLRVE